MLELKNIGKGNFRELVIFILEELYKYSHVYQYVEKTIVMVKFQTTVNKSKLVRGNDESCLVITQIGGKVSGRMDGWMNGWTDIRIIGQASEWMGGWIFAVWKERWWKRMFDL